MRSRVQIRQSEDGMFVAECPTFPGCISQGKTRVEAVENIKDAIKECIENLKMENKPVPPSIIEDFVEIAE